MVHNTYHSRGKEKRLEFGRDWYKVNFNYLPTPSPTPQTKGRVPTRVGRPGIHLLHRGGEKDIRPAVATHRGGKKSEKGRENRGHPAQF